MGSPAVAAFIAQVAFWALMAVSILSGELRGRSCGVFLSLWLIALVGEPYRPYWLPFSTCVAVLDIALVFAVAKGDVRLS
jgi:hypothetical protein